MTSFILHMAKIEISSNLATDLSIIINKQLYPWGKRYTGIIMEEMAERRGIQVGLKGRSRLIISDPNLLRRRRRRWRKNEFIPFPWRDSLPVFHVESTNELSE